MKVADLVAVEFINADEGEYAESSSVSCRSNCSSSIPP